MTRREPRRATPSGYNGAAKVRAFLRSHPGRAWEYREITNRTGVSSSAVSAAIHHWQTWDPGVLKLRKGVCRYDPPAEAPAQGDQAEQLIERVMTSGPVGEFLHMDDQLLVIRHMDGRVIVAAVRTVN
jgi:hypothetical protein